MEPNIANEIVVKLAALPLEAQREVLEFVEFKLRRVHEALSAAENRPPFRSVRGILQGEYPELERHIAEMRQEAGVVAIGQGEVTFEEVIKALDAGTPLDQVQGLALKRDGRLHFTGRRATVHLNERFAGRFRRPAVGAA